jgi:NADH:ubiquinone reductase (H+-translocating)
VAVGTVPTIQGHPDVIALGDMASVHDADGNEVALRGLASTAIHRVATPPGPSADVRGTSPHGPSTSVDKGNLATIGRAHPVAEIKSIQINGMLAWLIWLSVHIFYLIGLQNPLLVLPRWAFSFVTRGRGARLITGNRPRPRRRSGLATVDRQ